MRTRERGRDPRRSDEERAWLETDLFAARGVEYVDGAVTLAEPHYFARQMFEMWGERLGITEVTVKAHLRNIYAKIGAQNRAHAVTIALQQKLIESGMPVLDPVLKQ